MMKRFLKVLIFLVALVIGIIVYFPNEEAGRLLMSMASNQLSSRGVRLEYTDVKGIDGGILVNNLKVAGGVNINFREAEFIPQFIGSITGLAPKCRVNFKGCSVQMGATMNLGDGRVTVSATPSEINLEDLRTNGELSLNGSLAVNPSTQRITRANARVNVPDSLAPHMNMLKSFLPLVEDGGRWYLRR
ncbi:MAG: hypothetical protein IJR85_08980 [Synergistaceae bacterium]|nr:hypothetical protein [Synergistaceae bacterium]